MGKVERRGLEGLVNFMVEIQDDHSNDDVVFQLVESVLEDKAANAFYIGAGQSMVQRWLGGPGHDGRPYQGHCSMRRWPDAKGSQRLYVIGARAGKKGGILEKHLIKHFKRVDASGCRNISEDSRGLSSTYGVVNFLYIVAW